MLDTVIRQIEILKAIPRSPRKVAVSEIRTRLCNAGHEVTVRTIQRDLLSLSAHFAIAGDEKKPQGWYWQGDPIRIPALDPQEALTFSLVEHFLKPLLPQATLSVLQPHFRAAAGILLASGKLGRWPNKVRVVPRGLALLPPNIDAGIQNVIYDSLFQEKQIRVHYHPREEPKPKEYLVNPLGIVIRNQVVYLVCTLWRYDEILQLALHRIIDAVMLDTPSRAPKDFDLDHYIWQGGFSYPASEKPIKLRALFDEGAAKHLHETPLSSDQILTPQDDGGELLEATVRDTSELRWWLLAFGSAVEVLSPKALRTEFQFTGTELAKIYG